jgi:hypothetical protein
MCIGGIVNKDKVTKEYKDSFTFEIDVFNVRPYIYLYTYLRIYLNIPEVGSGDWKKYASPIDRSHPP